LERRTFIFAGFAAAMNAAMGNRAETPQLETLTQWLAASRKTRQAALRSCLDRIRSMDSSIHAWVQVQPQRPTGNGRLAEIPFGAKDIMETRGLSTEYGSPIYKGRIGTTDAAIVRDLRQRGAIGIEYEVQQFSTSTNQPTVRPSPATVMCSHPICSGSAAGVCAAPPRCTMCAFPSLPQ